MPASMRSAVARKRVPAAVSSLPEVWRRNSFAPSASSSAARRRRDRRVVQVEAPRRAEDLPGAGDGEKDADVVSVHGPPHSLPSEDRPGIGTCVKSFTLPPPPSSPTICAKSHSMPVTFMILIAQRLRFRSRCQARPKAGQCPHQIHQGERHDRVRAFHRRQAVKGTSGRSGDVFQPMTGEVRGKVALGLARLRWRAAVENAKAAQPAWAATNPQRRARVLMKFLELVPTATMTSSPTASPASTARPSPTPRATSSAGWRWSSLHRRAASDEGRVHRRRRPRHRHLFDAPAARRGRRHHAVQLPGDDPAVEDARRRSPAATPSS